MKAFAIVALTVIAACDPGLSGFSSGSSGTLEPSDAATPMDASAAADASDGTVSDAGPDGSSDAGEAGPTCGTNPSGPYANGFDCTAGSDCCSGSCLESKRCAATCLAMGAGGCSTSMSTCCSGAYCSVTAGTKCSACIPKGSPPEMVGGAPNSKSCCDRKIQTVDGGVLCDND